MVLSLGSESVNRSVVSDSVTPWTVAQQVPLSMDFSMQEYWSGWTFPSPGDLPHTGIEPRTLALQADALPSEPPGKLQRACRMMIILTPLLLSLAG